MFIFPLPFTLTYIILRVPIISILSYISKMCTLYLPIKRKRVSKIANSFLLTLELLIFRSHNSLPFSATIFPRTIVSTSIPVLLSQYMPIFYLHIPETLFQFFIFGSGLLFFIRKIFLLSPFCILSFQI